MGYTTICLSDVEMADFYKSPLGFEDLILPENEYVIMENYKGEIVDKFCYQHGKIRTLIPGRIENRYMGSIKPRNLEQEFAFDMFLDRSSQVKVLRGVYGAGKDFIMLNAALQLIERGEFDQIIYVRPNVTVKNVPEIGFLPGDVDDKLAWTLGPIADNIGGEDAIEFLVKGNKLKVIPLPFIRGRSFTNSIVYVSEGQNMTLEIVKLLLGRIGEGSELWINSDIHQTDSKVFDKDNGVTRMIDALKGNDLVSYVSLIKSERSKVAELATLLDELEERERATFNQGA